MTANSKPQLLIVDDEPAILLSYRIILERKGYDVETAADSPSAHELLNQRQFDMLLCDLGLEQPLSGMKIVRWARQNRPQMACILLSGYPDEQITEEADRTGVHTLCKPVEVPALLETIQCVLQSNSKS